MSWKSRWEYKFAQSFRRATYTIATNILNLHSLLPRRATSVGLSWRYTSKGHTDVLYKDIYFIVKNKSPGKIKVSKAISHYNNKVGLNPYWNENGRETVNSKPVAPSLREGFLVW